VAERSERGFSFIVCLLRLTLNQRSRGKSSPEKTMKDINHGGFYYQTSLVVGLSSFAQER